MAERPIFVPAPESAELVKELPMQIVWNPGFASAQKKKNIMALHAAAAKAGYSPLLEISTKSDEAVGRHLSAFNLKVHHDHLGSMPLEAAFQGSKVFERGGPYTDLYIVRDVRDAKRDARLKASGPLIGFKLADLWFPLEPKTAFYDWLYVTSLYDHREWLRTHIFHYAGFTDIEFDPERAINCQARSCALLIALIKNESLDEAVSSPEAFIRLLSSRAYQPQLARHTSQETISKH